MKLFNKSTGIVLAMLMTSCFPVNTTPNDDKGPVASLSPSPSAGIDDQKAPVNLKPKDGIIVNLTDGKVSVGGQIIDAKTNQVINKPIKISINGKDADKVDKVEFSVSNGLFTFELKKNIVPTSSSPVIFTVVAEAEGYFSSSDTVRVADKDGSSFRLSLVNVNNPPEGVSTVKKETKAGSNGAISEPLNISLSSSGAGSSASFNLNQNTVITDRNGQPLVGDLKTEIGFFNNLNQESLQAFPGGFAATVNTAQNNQQSGFFTTGGFLSIRITDQNGKEAEKFSKDANLTIQIPQGTINPETGNPIKNNDKIGIWSYDDNSGQWKWESEGVATGPDAKGNFTVKFDAAHLSYWNLDWFSNDTCNPRLNIKWKDNVSYYPVDIKVNFKGMESQSWVHDGHIYEANNELFNFPTDREVIFTFNIGEKLNSKKSIKLNKKNSSGSFWWDGRECTEDINVELDITKETKVLKLPFDVTFRIKNDFNMADLKAFLENLVVFNDPGLVNKILSITHGSNPESRFVFNPESIKKLKDGGISDLTLGIAESLIRSKFYPSLPFWYRNVTQNENWSFGTLNYGEEYSFFENETYEFKVYYKGQEYKKEYTVNKETKQLINDIELPASLAVDVMRNKITAQ